MKQGFTEHLLPFHRFFGKPCSKGPFEVLGLYWISFTVLDALLICKSNITTVA